MELICLLCPSAISVYIYVKHYLKNNKPNLIFNYYIFSVLLNYLIMNITLYNILHLKDTEFTRSFAYKYIILSSLVAIHIPILLNILNKLTSKCIELYINFTNKILDKFNNISKIISTSKPYLKLSKYLKDHKENIKSSIIFISFTTIQLLLFDLVIRYIIHRDINFYQIYNLTPNILTISYGILLGTILTILPKTISKICYSLVYIFSLLLFITNYMLINIKSEAFTIYNFQIANEGFEYINFIIKEINILFIIIIIISLFIFIKIITLLNKSTWNFKSTYKLTILIISLILFFGLRFISINILKDYNTNDGWMDITYPKYYTENLINSRRNVAVLGLYEYTLKDIQNYIKTNNESYGSIEEIEEIINSSNITYQENKMSGIFKDKNVIMIMMESIDNVVIDKETMPTLYKLKNQGWNFTQRYSQLNSGGSTIATEYTTLTGLYYTYNDKYDINNYNESIPSMFKNNNYLTSSFHENFGIYYNRSELHKSFGFENSYFIKDMNIEYEQYEDHQFFSNEKLYDLVVPKNNDKPFYSFLITISAHGPYGNKDSCKVPGVTNESECLRHLSKKTDTMLKIMLENLEKDNLLDDTVIILYSDHPAYSYNYTEEELSKTYQKIGNDYSIKNLPFIIYNSQITANNYNDIIVNDIDFAPTIFNLFGINYEPKNYVGTDIFADYHKNICMFKDYSWYDGKNYSETTNKNEYYYETSKYVQERINFSNMLVSNNYYKKNNSN